SSVFQGDTIFTSPPVQNLIWIMVYSSERGSSHLRRGETMRRRPVILREEQEQELRHCREQHDLPYMRLKAAAILKVATGQTIKQVALTGLNKPVTQECVSVWISRYEQEGLAGLRVQPGRGRKASFSPCARQRSAQRRRPSAGRVLPLAPAL